jgi:hypothetical protein
MSLLALIVIAVVVAIILLFAGGYAAARGRSRLNSARLTERIKAADRALEAARAADRGWDPVLLEEAAREGLERERPQFHYDRLHLVLVDDRPGTDQDRCEMAAVGEEGVLHVVVARKGDSWVAESVR